MIGAPFNTWGEVVDAAYYTGAGSGEWLWLLISILLCILALWWGHGHESRANIKAGQASNGTAASLMGASAAVGETKSSKTSAGPKRLKKAEGKADDLKKISGVGPKLERTLNNLGFWHFSQIAEWTKEDVAIVDDELSFKGRIERDDWIKQAKALAKKK